jgi:fatty-acyl-CoA synthase
VPKDGASLTLDILNVPVEQAIAQGAITRYAKLDRFTVIEALPRTSVGKLDKKLLRARFVQTEPH